MHLMRLLSLVGFDATKESETHLIHNGPSHREGTSLLIWMMGAALPLNGAGVAQGFETVIWDFFLSWQDFFTSICHLHICFYACLGK
jgi:hypothetical protein